MKLHQIYEEREQEELKFKVGDRPRFVVTLNQRGVIVVDRGMGTGTRYHFRDADFEQKVAKYPPETRKEIEVIRNESKDKPWYKEEMAAALNK